MIFFIDTVRSPGQGRQSISQSLITKIIKLKKELKNNKKNTKGLRKKNSITIHSVFSVKLK
jgi:hypothetical protein